MLKSTKNPNLTLFYAKLTTKYATKFFSFENKNCNLFVQHFSLGVVAERRIEVSNRRMKMTAGNLIISKVDSRDQ